MNVISLALVPVQNRSENILSHCCFLVHLNTSLSYLAVFMAVEEVNEAEEEVALETELSTSPLPTLPEEFLSCKFFFLSINKTKERTSPAKICSGLGRQKK